MTELKVGQSWLHLKTGNFYEVIAIGPMKVLGKWSMERVVTYKNLEGMTFNRYESDFRRSFTCVED